MVLPIQLVSVIFVLVVNNGWIVQYGMVQNMEPDTDKNVTLPLGGMSYCRGAGTCLGGGRFPSIRQYTKTSFNMYINNISQNTNVVSTTWIVVGKI